MINPKTRTIFQVLMLILKNIAWKNRQNWMLEKTQIWREHESAACLIHIWRMLDKSIMCQAAKGSNCPFLENSIRCEMTQFDERPLVYLLMMIAHWLMMSKNNSMLLLLWWKLLTAALAIDRPLANLLMLTADDKCPLATSLMLTRLSVWQPLVNFIDIFPPLSAERRDNLLQNIFELPPL